MLIHYGFEFCVLKGCVCVYACNVFLVLFSVLFYSFFFFACFSKERESEKEGIKLDGGREDLEGYEGEAMIGIYCINIKFQSKKYCFRF